MDKLLLVIEENKLQDRFEGTVTTAILEVINKEENPVHIERITDMLIRFNIVIKTLDEMLGMHKRNNDWAFYENQLDEKTHAQVQLQLSKILIGNICDAIFYAVDKEDDPALEAYIPFRAFSRYLINKGFAGVAYRSTRMSKIGLRGKCITLFNVEDATFVNGEMEVYEYHKSGCDLIKKY